MSTCVGTSVADGERLPHFDARGLAVVSYDARQTNPMVATPITRDEGLPTIVILVERTRRVLGLSDNEGHPLEGDGWMLSRNGAVYSLETSRRWEGTWGGMLHVAFRLSASDGQGKVRERQYDNASSWFQSNEDSGKSADVCSSEGAPAREKTKSHKLRVRGSGPSISATITHGGTIE